MAPTPVVAEQQASPNGIRETPDGTKGTAEEEDDAYDQMPYGRQAFDFAKSENPRLSTLPRRISSAAEEKVVLFVPKYIRELHMHLGNVPLTIPYCHSQFGVMLMIDICGYSKLTTQISRLGIIGAETVNDKVGQIFGEAIKVIEKFDGDIIKFLGDAILVCFQQTDNDYAAIIQSNREDFSDAPSTIFSNSDAQLMDSSSLRHRNKLHYTPTPDDLKLKLINRGICCAVEILNNLSASGFNISTSPDYRTRDASDKVPTSEHEQQKPPWLWTGKDRLYTASGGQSLPQKPQATGKDQEMFYDFFFHASLAAGDISNIVLGAVGGKTYDIFSSRWGRFEYFIYGDCIAELGDALYSAGPGMALFILVLPVRFLVCSLIGVF